jgi:two-component system chemotaxis response regulator CheV
VYGEDDSLDSRILKPEELFMDTPNNAVLLESDTNELEIVEFRIDEYNAAGEVVPCHYGVNVAKVREIIRLPQLWKVFNSHPAIAGMIKLRDKVITVINLAELLNKRIEDMQPERVIVLEFNRLVVGVLVHSVSRIYRISWEQVEPPVKGVNATQITGLVKMNDRIILVLDFEKIVGELCGQYLMDTFQDQLPEDSTDDARRRKKVLVADDSPFIRNTMCSALRGAGFIVCLLYTSDAADELDGVDLGGGGGG